MIERELMDHADVSPSSHTANSVGVGRGEETEPVGSLLTSL
jgi:hypothetical protein